MSQETLKQKSEKLWGLLERGPDTDPFFQTSHGLTVETEDAIKDEIRRSYKLWSESWVLPLLKKLIPSLKDKETKFG